MSLTFQRAIENLYGLERSRQKLGLDGTRALLRGLGDPHLRFRAVHVAGTNGKGSVCALIERVLRSAGHRTGLFTSPHLVDYRERMRVAGRWVDLGWLETTLERIQALPEGNDRTFFEVTTALGFADFAARGVEWAVVEVGLGGRLDCTNVITPEVCAITNIGLDHTEILGESLEDIAREKAGIIKSGVPVVTAVAPEGPLEVIERAAAEASAPLEIASLAAPVWPGGTPGAYRAMTGTWGAMTLEVGLAGDQAPNVSCALAVLDQLAKRGLEIPRQAIERGFREARWPGRLEASPLEPRLWWDGAHNAAGAAHLARSWTAAGLPPVEALVLAVSRDKDLSRLLEPLRRVAPAGRLIATRTRNARSLPAESLAALASASGFEASIAPDVASACRAALAASRGPVLLAGSLFAVGEAMESMGGAPGELL